MRTCASCRFVKRNKTYNMTTNKHEGFWWFCTLHKKSVFPLSPRFDICEKYQESKEGKTMTTKAATPNHDDIFTTEIERAAYKWWLSHRPAAYDEQTHIKNAAVNAYSRTGGVQLANAVADKLKAGLQEKEGKSA